MAKKSASEPCAVTCRPNPSLHLDITEDQVKGLALGTIVDVKAKGKIISARLPDDWDKENDFPGSMQIELQDLSVTHGDNEFSILAEDD